MSHHVAVAALSPQRQIPAHQLDEKAMLRAWLEFARQTIAAKVAGLTDEQLTTRRVPSATTLAGIVAHLTTVEQHWFGNVLGGHNTTMPFDADHPDGDWDTTDITIDTLLTSYRAACDNSDHLIELLNLDDTGQQTDSNYTLRWTLLHVLGDTQRHAGQADILREQTDQTAGW
jgi:uncharacterized damage-inducible protein DinB